MHCGEGYGSKENVRKLIIVQGKRTEKAGIKQKVYIRENTVKDEYRCYIRKTSKLSGSVDRKRLV